VLIVENFLAVKKFSTTATTAAIHVKTCCVRLRSPRQLRVSHHDCNRGRNRDSVNGVLASGEGIVLFVVVARRPSVRLSRCVYVRHSNLGGEGNALYPVLSSYCKAPATFISGFGAKLPTVCRHRRRHHQFIIIIEAFKVAYITKLLIINY